MTNNFSAWLTENGLREVFTTSAGDTLYVNTAKKFGVLKKSGEFGVQTFYLNDIIEFKTYDDENLVAEWNCMNTWRVLQRSTRYSTNEVYMKIRLKNQTELRLQLFHGTKGNIKRDSPQHVKLINYACQISQIIYKCAVMK